jgi:hypothetical protein
MNKRLLLAGLLFFVNFILPIAYADGVNITANVVSPTPPTPGMGFIKTTGSLAMGAGGLTWLLGTFVFGSPPEEKIKLVIAGAIGFLFMLGAIGVILAL